METIKRIFGLARPYRRKLFIGMAIQTIIIFTHLLAPNVTQSIVNDVITDGQYDQLLPLCAVLLVLVVIRAVGNYTRGMMFESVGQNVAYDLRTGLYAHLEELPYQFYDKHRIGEIMSRMTGDLDGVRAFYAAYFVHIFHNLLMFPLAFVFMVMKSWEVTLMVLTLAPLLSYIAYLFRKRIKPALEKIQEQNAVLNTRTQENLAGMHVVKAFAQEAHEEEQFVKENQDLMHKNLKYTRITSNFIPFTDFLASLFTPLSLLGCALMISMGRMDIGTAVGALGLVGCLWDPLRQIPTIINMITQTTTSANRVFYYVDFGSAIQEPEDAQSPEDFKGHVVFDHVNFSYGDHPILKDICLEAKPGETIAIMGATGSGKSTLITLLGRFYDIQSGSLLIDGIDVRKQKLKPLRRQIGYVMQETFLFSDTIADNIRYGNPDADMQRVERSAKVAQAKEFIEHMPNGYETVVGERGLGLSGGQKQRTAIARAVLIDPKILVLDDSTSAVDMETEYEIQQELKEVLKNRTTFIIAHRISSVKNADQIIVLDNGAIAERGNHKTLMAQGGIYYQMVMDQMASAVKV